jgi:nucleotide-binding universal stress UspA family protein
MIKIERVLHPTDFSDRSASAARYAGFLAEQFGAELHLLYVIEDALGKIPNPQVGFPPPDECYEKTVDGPSDEMRTALGLEWHGALRVVLATKLGPTADAIVQYAQLHHMDMVVMGTHGRRGVAHALMGSVAESVMRRSPCPALTVRSTTEQPERDELRCFGASPLSRLRLHFECLTTAHDTNKRLTGS